MSTATMLAPDTRSTRRPASRPPRKKDAKPTRMRDSEGYVKKGFYLSGENARRLALHALVDNVGESEIVNMLVKRHLRGIRLHDDRAATVIPSPTVSDDAAPQL